MSSFCSSDLCRLRCCMNGAAAGLHCQGLHLHVKGAYARACKSGIIYQSG